MNADGERDGWRADAPAAPIVPAILGSRCPCCGKGRLFSGFITLAPGCGVCGLDFAKADPGDGPAVFVILFAGAIVTVAALVTEVLWAPPYWAHLALWLPLTLAVSLGLLRPVKAALVVLQYRHKAAEGRL